MADEQEHVTIREFDAFKQAIVEAIDRAAVDFNKNIDRFGQQLMNDRKTTQELLRITGALQTQLQEHERRLNSGAHRHIRKDDPPAPTGDNEPLTMKDLKRAAYVAAAVLATAIAVGIAFLTSVLERRP